MGVMMTCCQNRDRIVLVDNETIATAEVGVARGGFTMTAPDGYRIVSAGHRTMQEAPSNCVVWLGSFPQVNLNDPNFRAITEWTWWHETQVNDIQLTYYIICELIGAAHDDAFGSPGL